MTPHPEEPDGPDRPPEQVDPDAPGAPTTTRPVHVRPGSLALVAVGGALGTGAREALSLALPPVDGVPLTTLGINVVGAFVLGALLQTLLLRGDDTGGRRRWRLFAGTGVLGGFTTYSAVATDTAQLGADRPLVAAGYALGTLLLGLLAAGAGALLGRRTGGAR